MKTCSDCGVSLSVENAHRYKRGEKAGRLGSYCRPCKRRRNREWATRNPGKNAESKRRWLRDNLEKRREASRKWQKENPARAKENKLRWQRRNPKKYRSQERNSQRKLKYGLTEAAFNQLMTACGSRCGICFCSFSCSVLPQIDHNHDTGKVRGLLCRSCNLQLGIVERKEWLAAALRYLGACESPEVMAVCSTG